MTEKAIWVSLLRRLMTLTPTPFSLTFTVKECSKCSYLRKIMNRVKDGNRKSI